MADFFDQAGASVSAAIKRIAEDNCSGAAEMLARAAEVFSTLAALQADRDDSIHSARLHLLETCVALVRAQPGMAPLANLASRAADASTLATNAALVMQSAAEAASIFVDEARRANRSAALYATDLIQEGATVLTHSRSSTVVAAFLAARHKGRAFKVIATESRPMLEGRQVAEELARAGLSVTLIADAAAAHLMERADFILVGADKVTPAVLINKIGTRMIALAARELDLPVYALCDTTKFINAAHDVLPDENPRPEELWPDAPPDVEVLNGYFEPTPLDCFSRIITEDGPLAAEEARRRAEASLLAQPLVDALSGKKSIADSR